MKKYLELLQDIYTNGHDHDDRTGVGRRSIFGTQTRYKLSEGFPLVTTRKIFTRGMIEETLWFISGSHMTTELKEKGVKIWDNWAVTEKDVENYLKDVSGSEEENLKLKTLFTKVYEDSVGPMYGFHWRNTPRMDDDETYTVVDALTLEELPKDKLERYKESYEAFKTTEEYKITPDLSFEKYATNIYYTESVDQLNDLIINLKKRPFSSRHVVTAWIPSLNAIEGISPQKNVLIGKGALSACHCMFQCFVRPGDTPEAKKKLSLQVQVRSNDVPIGNPYNVSQYALLTHMLAHVTDMEPDELVFTTGDTHIYKNQIPFVLEQLAREPRPLPKLWLNPEIKSIYDFTVNDIRIEGYDPHPVINYPIAI